MKVLPALEVKSRFGRVSNIVKGGELVTITQHGEPTMVLFPIKLAQEALKAYRTIGKQTNNQQDEGEGLLEWLESRTAKPAPATPSPVFDEVAEKERLLQMIEAKHGMKLPRFASREEAIASADQAYEEARKKHKSSDEMTEAEEEEFMKLVDEAREEVWQEQQAEKEKSLAPMTN